VIILTTALFIVSLFFARRLHLEENIAALLPDTDPVTHNYRFVIERFHTLDALYIDIGAENGSNATEQDVISVSDALYERLSNSGLFSHIRYKISQNRLSELLDNLNAKRAYLLTNHDLNEIEKVLSEEEIEKRLVKAKQALLEPSGPFVRDSIQKDPLGISNGIVEKLKKLDSEAENVQVKDERIWSKDSRHILMVGAPKFPAADVQKDQQLVTCLEESRREVLKNAQGKVTISYAAGHIATLDNAQAIKGDVSTTMLVVSIGVIVLGIMFFKRKIYVLMIFIPALFGLTLAVGIFGTLETRLSAIAIGCGAVLVGIAVDYGIHILYWLDNSENETPDPKKIVKESLFPLLVGSGTTIGAFLCLGLSSLPGQRQIGYFATVGLAASELFGIFALPHFIPRFKSKSRGKVLPLVDYCRSFFAWRTEHNTLFNIITLAITTFCAIGLLRLKLEGNVDKLNYLRAADSQDQRRILSVWGSFSPTSVVVRGKTIEEALYLNDCLSEKLSELAKKEEITSFATTSLILPSRKTQEGNFNKWNAFWSQDRIDKLQTDMSKVAEKLKFAPTAFKPFFDTLKMKQDFVTLADFDGTGIDEFIRSCVAAGENEYLVLSTFAPASRENLQNIIAQIETAVPGTIVMDKRMFVEHVTSLVYGELANLSIAALVVITLLLFLSFVRIELVILTLLPVGVCILLTLGTLGWLNVPINLINTLFIIFIFGVGIDFSIFILNSSLSKYRGEVETEALTTGSVIVCALTTIVGFATLLFAEHPGLFSIGVTGFIGITASMATAILIVPPLASKLIPEEGRYGTPSIKTMGGAVWAFAYLVGLALLYLCFLRFVMILVYPKDKEARARFTRRYIHLTAVGLLKFFPYLDSRRIYINAPPQAFKPAGIIVSNHLAAFDIMVILALPTEMVMVVKKWVYDAPLMGKIAKDANFILADKTNIQDMTQLADKYMKQGICVMIFPEGTRSPDGRMRRFHKGAFEIAVRTSADIIPVHLSNTQSCTPRKAFWVGDHQAVIRALERITPGNFDYSAGSKAIAQHAKNMLLARENEDWRIAQNGKTFWHNIRSLYNYRGGFVETRIAWKLRFDRVYRKVDNYIPEEGQVLDLRCGYGLMSNILAHKSLRRQVIGIDSDKSKITIAKQTALATNNLSFESADILNWDYPEADAVILVDALHYWTKEEQHTIISKACKRLRSSGTLFFRSREGLLFSEKEFYLKAFREEGLRLVAEPQELRRGSNIVLVFKKDTG
jgi:1-acyl-sn-glycerol-3-phosphate acyltransferase